MQAFPFRISVVIIMLGKVADVIAIESPSLVYYFMRYNLVKGKRTGTPRFKGFDDGCK